MKISAVILTKNEEKNIKACIESLSFCDEILIVDSNSSDWTREIARKAGAKVQTHELAQNFSGLRNYGLSIAKNDWILFVDADERMTPSLRDEILGNITLDYDGFYLKRADFMWGRELRFGETRDVKLLRLAKKNKGTWFGRAHEVWRVEGRIGELQNRLPHYPHPTLDEFLDEIQAYTDLRAKELFERRKKVMWFQILAYPIGKFFVNYFLKRGIFDGLPGLLFALMMSLHSFLVRGKLWLLWDKEKQ